MTKKELDEWLAVWVRDYTANVLPMHPEDGDGRCKDYRTYDETLSTELESLRDAVLQTYAGDHEKWHPSPK